MAYYGARGYSGLIRTIVAQCLYIDRQVAVSCL